MRLIFLFILCISLCQLDAQIPVYQDEFDVNILSVGDNPTGYTMNLVDEAFQINGDGSAVSWTAMAYFIHNGTGSNTILDASEQPKLYIKARGTNQCNLRIDFQDQTGYVTNLDPLEVELDEEYAIYELDYNGHLLDGGYGGPCTNAPCEVDASALQALILFVNAPDGGYTGTIDIDWISIGAPLEDTGAGLTEIRYNQVSYTTDRPKFINIVSSVPFTDIPYSIFKDGETTAVMQGEATGNSKWTPSNEYATAIDITAINDEGNYIFETEEESISFTISSNGYELLSEASLKYYYFNRASQELTSEFAGSWARPLGHPDDEVIIHSSAASLGRPTGTIISSPKGWYDAGDYNKYIVNSGISTYTLLAAYEHYPAYYKALKIDIPEQGGDLPDILDEVIWNLDWMLSMQDPGDGGVYHKLTGLNFSGIVMPHQYNFDRYVVQKSTAASLNFAAVLATASRIFEEYEDVRPGYSEELIEAAIFAYEWAKSNPTKYYNQPNDVNTGEYGDGNVKDEFDWAAAELFITTGESIYRDDINENSIGTGVPAWPYTAPLALISLSHHASEVENDINIATITTKLVSTANQLKAAIDNSELRVAMSNNGDYVWGSNGVAGNQIMMLIRAYEATGEKSYLDAAYIGIDYILGRNGTGFSYVTGFGTKPTSRPHHRQSEADNVNDPVPGMVAGGPNPGQQDNCPGYPNNYPASSYVDSWCSYASNEVTINWNAPFAYCINALQFYQVGVINSIENLPTTGDRSLKIYPNPGTNSVYVTPLEKATNQRLEIIDLSGRVVIETNIKDSSNIDVSSLQSGLYIFRLFDGKSIHKGKWLKLD